MDSIPPNNFKYLESVPERLGIDIGIAQNLRGVAVRFYAVPDQSDMRRLCLLLAFDASLVPQSRSDRDVFLPVGSEDNL